MYIGYRFWIDGRACVGMCGILLCVINILRLTALGTEYTSCAVCEKTSFSGARCQYSEQIYAIRTLQMICLQSVILRLHKVCGG